MRARNLFMICANPDIVVERGDRLVYCAGALADAYAALGGEVYYAGKPHRPIYDLALGEIRARGTFARRRRAAQPRAGDRRSRCAPTCRRRASRRRLPVRHGRHPSPRSSATEAIRTSRRSAGCSPPARRPKAVTTRLAW